jgi:tRNA 2-thiouridine synthesizing protein E
MSTVATTDQGFLKNHWEWTAEIALQLAEQQKINLQAQHWAVIYFTRNFFEKNQYAPIQRQIVKYLQSLNPNTSSIDLKMLFPNGPRQICLIAGLRKPARCV